MTVCRYFLQGTCRFGDRCRFEHIESNYENQRNVGVYQERNSRQRGQSNNYQHYNQHVNDSYESGYNYNQAPSYSENYQQYNYNQKPRSYSSDRGSQKYQNNYSGTYSTGGNRDNRYGSNNYYEGQRSYSQDRYSDNTRTNLHNYKHGYETQSHNYRQGYEAQPHNYRQGYDRSHDYRQSYEAQPQYNEHSYGKNQQHPSNNYRNNDKHDQNKYQWVSDDYRKQTQQKSYSNNKSTDNLYATSTPKAKSPFSFRVPESEIKKDNSAQYQVNDQDQLHAELVKEDAKAWELGGLWPFTCYFPCPNKHAFPGFCDLSPEELRYAAYKAEENNAYDSYVQSVQNAVIQINQQRSQLQITTPQLLATLRRIWNGENLYYTTNFINSIPFIDETGIDVMDTPTTVFPASSGADSFSFKMTTETEHPKSAASAFSFKLPSNEVKSAVTAGDVDVYTPLENLTEEEKQQFSASTFVLGKIPTNPPPQVLCS